MTCSLLSEAACWGNVYLCRKQNFDIPTEFISTTLWDCINISIGPNLAQSMFCHVVDRFGLFLWSSENKQFWVESGDHRGSGGKWSRFVSVGAKCELRAIIKAPSNENKWTLHDTNITAPGAETSANEATGEILTLAQLKNEEIPQILASPPSHKSSLKWSRLSIAQFL